MNHITGIDSIIAIQHFNGHACFLASDHVRNAPVIGYLVKASGGHFVNRAASVEVRDATVKSLGDH